jgi:cysteine desulfurase
MDERVLEAMKPYFCGIYGNASSVHHFGREAKTALEETREKVAALIGAQASEIYFTSGGTEADNIAVKGSAHIKKAKRDHVITSAIEHHAVLEAVKFLGKEGYKTDILGVDKFGTVSPDELREKITDKTSVVSIMLANNEVGTIQDIKTMAEIAKEKGAVFHTDAVQAIGKMNVNVAELGVDMLAMSAHKFYGPNGVGVLYIKKGHRLTPLFHGGHHEKGRRPGTEDVAGVVGLGRALELAVENWESEHKRLKGLADYFIDAVPKNVPSTYLNGPRDDRRVPSTVNISFEYIEGESIILSLDMKGIGVASGSACTSGSLDPSHVLTAMGVPVELAQGSIRFSMGRYTTSEDLEYTVECLPEIIERLRSMSPLYSEKQKAN